MADTPKRNDPCHCGSGRKYKNCCLDNDNATTLTSKVGIIGLVIAVILGLWFVGTSLSGGESTPECPPDTNWSATHQHCH